MADTQGSVIGVGAFGGGETTVERVSSESVTVLERCNGFKADDGVLRPDGLVLDLTAASMDAGVTMATAQVPATLVDAAGTRIIARDYQDRLRVYSGGAWGTKNAASPAVPGSTPAKWLNQIVLPTKQDLAIFEPDSAGSNYRPISLKGPGEYNLTPTVAPSAIAPVKLFDCDDADPWTAGPNSVIANTGDKTVIGVFDDVGVIEFIAKKSLGVTGVSLTGAAYLVMDISIMGDPQLYSAVKESVDYPLGLSGYILTLWENADCTGLITHYMIPRLPVSSYVYRVAFPISSSATVKGVSISTAKFFDAPDIGSSCSISIFSGAYADNGGVDGNWLLGETLYPSAIAPADTVSIIHSRDLLGNNQDPESPLVRYCAVYAGKDRLSVGDTYNLMLSNPSDQTANTFCDPWRTYTVTLAGNATAIAVYGDYLTHVLFYRQVYDGATQTWSAWTFFGSSPIGASVSIVDDGTTADTIVDDHDVPTEVEINHAPASTARFVVANKGRVVCLGLDWSESAGKWLRPLALQVSNFQDAGSYPTLVDSYTLSTDGTELDGYAMTGTDSRGLLVVDDDILVLLDCEFFVLRGDDPVNGWRFMGRQLVGCKSNTSGASRGNLAIWHDGTDFIFYSNGATSPLSMNLVDSTKIDWTKPHSAAMLKDRYYFHCYYDGEYALICYNLRLQAWTIRRSAALALLGICADAETLYGLSTSGQLTNLLGSASLDGGGVPTRQAWTRLIRVAPEGKDRQINQIVLDIVASQQVDVMVGYRLIGARNHTQAPRSLTIPSTQTRHTLSVNALAEFIAIDISYTGIHCPSIHSIGVDANGEVAR